MLMVFAEGNGETMIFGRWWGRRAQAADGLYDGLMAAARTPEFYADLCVADSVDGRLEMLMLFVGLAVRRLAAEPDGQIAARDLSERFIADMQRSLRDLGYDDSGLKRRVKSAAAALYGRTEAVAEALAAGDGALAEVLCRNVYGGPSPHVERLAAHIRAYSDALWGLSVVDIAAGRLPSVPPSAISADNTSIGHLP